MEVGTLALLLVGGLFTCILFVVVVGVIALQSTSKKRKEAWQRAALALGLEMHEGGAAPLPFGFDIFTRQETGRTEVFLGGDFKGRRVSLGEHRYTTHSTRSTKTHTQTICVVETPGVLLPQLTIRVGATPDGGLLGAIVSLALPGQPVRFEDDPDFSSAFLVTSRSPTQAQQTLTPERRRFFLERRQLLEPLEVEANGPAILVASRQPLEPERMGELLEIATSIADRMAS
jgi:hypothetical protein